MKLLYVAHSLPFPIQEGIKLRVYHLLRQLSRDHEIHLACFVFSPDEKKNLPELEPFCRSITTIVHPVPRSPWQRISSMLLDKNPFCVRQFSSREMGAAVESLTAKIRPDVVHFDHTPMAQYAEHSGQVAKVFVPHDALSMLFQSSARNERNLARKFYYWNQYRKIQAYEQRVLPHFQKTVVVSPVDRRYLEAISPQASIEWNPNGVDCDYFSARPDAEREDVVLFRGIMDFFPNHDAALRFGEEVMPLIWAKRPKTEFWVAGHNPLKPLRKLAQNEPRIKLFGFVADLREPMAHATVIVSPMRSGSGIKNKVLESMAMAKAVVATPLSLAGINVEDSRDLLVAETAAELADKTLQLLNDAALRQTLGRNAAEFIRRNHSWKVHADFFNHIYKDALNLGSKHA
jgi:sugar transferase (PEP-CTERM/EpsH1 system associated)